MSLCEKLAPKKSRCKKKASTEDSEIVCHKPSPPTEDPCKKPNFCEADDRCKKLDACKTNEAQCPSSKFSSDSCPKSKKCPNRKWCPAASMDPPKPTPPPEKICPSLPDECPCKCQQNSPCKNSK